MRRLFTALALVAGVLASATAAPATSASAAIAPASAVGLGVRLVDAPRDNRDDPRARVYIIDHLAPGTVIHRRIELTNGTPVALKAAVYPAAADIDGGTFLGAAGHTANELSTWTTVAPANPTLPPGAKRLVTVTVAVPRDAAPGERYAVVWSEVRSAAPKGGGVTQVSRVGIRLYLSIGPGGAPAANFTITTLTAERSADGTPSVVATVQNTGGRAIDISGKLDLYAGPAGLAAGPFPATLGATLAPGQHEPVRIKLDKQLPAGPWTANVTLQSGLLQRSATATITFPAHGSAVPVKAAAGRQWLLPAAVGLTVLALVLLALLLLLRRRRRAQGLSIPEPELAVTR